ncbi:MAG: hypothetical protein ACP5NQ_08785 [Vulcanisaeta sp.]
MPWFIYYLDVFRPMSIEGYTIEAVVRNGAEITKNVLGNVEKYYLYDNGRVIVVGY